MPLEALYDQHKTGEYRKGSSTITIFLEERARHLDSLEIADATNLPQLISHFIKKNVLLSLDTRLKELGNHM